MVSYREIASTIPPLLFTVNDIRSKGLWVTCVTLIILYINFFLRIQNYPIQAPQVNDQRITGLVPRAPACFIQNFHWKLKQTSKPVV